MKMIATPFIGRKRELKKLQSLSKMGRACLAVVKGRRRIGKSRLIEEFAKNKKFLSFSGAAPSPKTTVASQIDIFARQMGRIFNAPQQTFADWSDALYYLTDQLTQEPTIILFDEISWMGDKDLDFVPKLKLWWDLELQKFPNLILIFCGSISLWIEKNIINSTAFFGRMSLQITLEELTLAECNQFLKAKKFHGPDYDIFKILAVTGGVPWYLEHISSDYLADDNIKQLCFEKGGLLTLEFNKIFHDLFNGTHTIYKNIVTHLADGMKDLKEIKKVLKYEQAIETLNELMESLISAGFVTSHYSWSLKTEERKQSHKLYRLSDNYIRFFIKYIEPNLDKINDGSYKKIPIQKLPNWDTMMPLRRAQDCARVSRSAQANKNKIRLTKGVHPECCSFEQFIEGQVENLLLNNRSVLLDALDVNPVDIIGDNPYIQRKTAIREGLQIDYLVQTRAMSLFVCEFKFKREEIKLGIIKKVKDKINKLQTPQGYGVVPALFHLSGVNESVYEKQYFFRIINIADFLQTS